MKWILPLYIGEKAEKKKGKIIRGIKKRKAFLNTYVLMLPNAPLNQLDIIEATELKQPFYKDKEFVIVGIAVGKEEAISLVAKITDDAISKTGSPMILDFLKAKQIRGMEDD